MKTIKQCAVIGAGLAGLSCASALQQAGLAVTVFEKSRGPAGRMSTRRGQDWQCDHGAQYFTARDPVFRAEVARWQAAGVADCWSPRLQVFGDGDQRETRSSVQRFVGVPRMTAPAHFLAQSLNVTQQTTITALRHDAEGWQLQSAEQGWLLPRFDAVALAVPAPQAAPLLARHAPDLAALAAATTMRASWALMLQFPAPLSLPFDAAFINEGPLRWVARDSSKPGRSGIETWLLHATADWSQAHLEQRAEEVATVLLKAFADLGAPAPQHWTAHRWRYADTALPLDQSCAWLLNAGLGLCGDWLAGGKVEGAWCSGRDLAAQIVSAT